MTEQISIDQNTWQWYLQLDQEQQANTLLLIFSPAMLAIAGTIMIVASLRQVWNPNDKQAWLMAIVIASTLGVLVILFMKGFINDALGIEFYKMDALAAAAVLTPIMNHVVFKILTAAIYVIYYIGCSIPEKHTFGWAGVPIQKLAKAGYFTVTGNKLTVKKVVDKATGETEEVTQTKIGNGNEE